ncbi:MAG: hypothetical protein JOY96_03540 [Verrucomicrobia bacterium]|nr:hypothetical protein [Verrucomicrobiota bacterium]MBV9674080.1 hypothetical protein [Verrucomicrobiota bacterium]
MKKIEVSLSDAHHELLLEHASRDKTHRSLGSITAGLLVDALSREVARYTVGRREQAISSLVAADLKRRKT